MQLQGIPLYGSEGLIGRDEEEDHVSDKAHRNRLMFLVGNLENAFSLCLCWECVGALAQLRFRATYNLLASVAVHHEMQLPCLRKDAF